MIDHNEELLSYLEEAKKLAEENQKSAKTLCLDTIHIGQAIDVVKARLRYLKSVASKKSAKDKPADKPAEKPTPKEPTEVKGGEAPPAQS